MKNLKINGLLLLLAIFTFSCGDSGDPEPDVAPNVVGQYRGTYSVPGSVNLIYGVDLSVTKTGTNKIMISPLNGSSTLISSFESEVREITAQSQIHGQVSGDSDFLIFSYMNDPSTPTEISYSINSLGDEFTGSLLSEMPNIAASVEGIYSGVANFGTTDAEAVEVRISRNGNTTIQIGEEGTAGIIQTIADIEIVRVGDFGAPQSIYEAFVSTDKVDLNISLATTPHVLEFTNKATGNSFVGTRKNE